MRKALLATSALVSAAALLSSPAFAQSESSRTVMTGDSDITVSGSARFILGVGGTKNGSNLNLGQNNSTTEVKFEGAAQTDTGLEYGVVHEVRLADGGNSADESYVKVAGGWGTVYIGHQDGGADPKVHGASVLPGPGGPDGNYGNFSEVSGPGVTAGSDSGDHAKIRYDTPDFQGVKGAVSWTPAASTNTSAVDRTQTENIIEAWVSMSRDFGGVGVRGDLSFGTGEVVDVGADGKSREANTRGSKKLDGSTENFWNVGGRVDVDAFSVSGSYGIKTQTFSGTAGVANGFANKWEYESTVFSLGAAFNYGPGSVGVGYAVEEPYDGGTNTASAKFSESRTAFSVGVDYTVAPGFGTFAEFVSVTDDTVVTTAAGNPNVDNSASIFMVGTTVAF